MKELQENTYSYKQSKTMGRRFRWAGIICCCVACIAAVFVGAMALQEYRREVDKQWIGKIKELEESVESATLSETEGTKEEEKKPEVGVLPDILKQYKTLHTLNEDLCG